MMTRRKQALFLYGTMMIETGRIGYAQWRPICNSVGLQRTFNPWLWIHEHFPGSFAINQDGSPAQADFHTGKAGVGLAWPAHPNNRHIVPESIKFRDLIVAGYERGSLIMDEEYKRGMREVIDLGKAEWIEKEKRKLVA